MTPGGTNDNLNLEQAQQRIAALEREVEGLRALNALDQDNWLKSMLDIMPAFVVIKDDQFRHLYANKSLLEHLGVSLSQFVGTRAGDFTDAETAAFLESVDQQVLTEKRPIDLEFLQLGLSDEESVRHEIKFPLRKKDGGYYIGVLSFDVSELHRRIDDFEQLFNLPGLMTFIGTIEGRFQKVNPTLQNLVGHDEDALRDKTMLDFVHPDDWTRTLRMIRTHIGRGSKTVRFQNRCRTANGEYRYLDWTLKPLPKKGIIFGMSYDLTELEQTRSALEQSRAEYRDLWENAPDMFGAVDMETRTLLRCNKTFANTLGYAREELIGRPIFDLYHPDSVPKGHKALKQFKKVGEIKELEIQLVHKDGRPIDLSLNAIAVRDEEGRIIQSRSVLRDISERKRMDRERKDLEALLRQSQKMEAIGTLAGGIAHDFNNLLSPILGYSELMMEDIPEDHPSRNDLLAIHAGARRAREIVAQMLLFSRKQDQDRTPVRLQKLVGEIIQLVRASLPATIEIRQNIRQDCQPVSANPSQVHQVIMNMVTNAKMAMEVSGGVLSLTMEETRISDRQDLDDGDYISLSIEDTGCGMGPEVLARAFEPYFTTKEKGKGTGLGLAAAHGIVTSMGGSIQVTSKVGVGSCFTILFPVAQSSDAFQEPVEEHVPDGQGEHVLLVDDNPESLKLAKRVLESLNYRVRDFQTPCEALDALKETPEAFDLLITDMTMPKLSGDHLIQQARVVAPNLPTILMTGYSEKINAVGARDQGIGAFVMKPLTRARLGSVVFDLLHKPATKTTDPRFSRAEG